MKAVGKVLSVEGHVLVKHKNGKIEELKPGDIIRMDDIVMCKHAGDHFVVLMENNLRLEIGEHTYVLFDQDFINKFLQLTYHLRSPFYAEHSLSLDPVDVNYKNYRFEHISKESEGKSFPYILVKNLLHVSVKDILTNDDTPPITGDNG